MHSGKHATADRGIASSGVNAVDVQSRLMPIKFLYAGTITSSLWSVQGTTSSPAWYALPPAHLRHEIAALKREIIGVVQGLRRVSSEPGYTRCAGACAYEDSEEGLQGAGGEVLQQADS